MKDYVLFRFVPTMGCNYRCNYCFVSEDQKTQPSTMFDLHTASEWVSAMELWNRYDVEFYMWGGEPFSTAGTYEVAKGWTQYDHVVCCSRIDTNMYYADQILAKCPSAKVKLNCSWHREYETLENFFDKVVRLKQEDMVGMANFVVNDANLRYLRTECGKDVDELVEMFDAVDVFMNIAADFSIFEKKNPFKKWWYKRLVSRYTCPEDWKQLRCEKEPGMCQANRHFFTVHRNGDITPCLGDEVVGNFFDGTLLRRESAYCAKRCPSLVAYPFRDDNDLPYRNNLMAYVDRNRRHRREVVSR